MHTSRGHDSQHKPHTQKGVSRPTCWEAQVRAISEPNRYAPKIALRRENPAFSKRIFETLCVCCVCPRKMAATCSRLFQESGRIRLAPVLAGKTSGSLEFSSGFSLLMGLFSGFGFFRIACFSGIFRIVFVSGVLVGTCNWNFKFSCVRLPCGIRHDVYFFESFFFSCFCLMRFRG